MALAASPVAASGTMETKQIGGKQFVRLSDWAKAQGLEIRWLKRDETLQLGNRSAKLLLTVDSREAQLNGAQFSAALKQFLGPPDIHRGEMGIERFFAPQNKADLQFMIDDVDSRADFVSEL